MVGLYDPIIRLAVPKDRGGVVARHHQERSTGAPQAGLDLLFWQFVSYDVGFLMTERLWLMSKMTEK